MKMILTAALLAVLTVGAGCGNTDTTDENQAPEMENGDNNNGRNDEMDNDGMNDDMDHSYDSDTSGNGGNDNM